MWYCEKFWLDKNLLSGGVGADTQMEKNLISIVRKSISKRDDSVILSTTKNLA